jgi:uncharacterized UPF0160 family protein
MTGYSVAAKRLADHLFEIHRSETNELGMVYFLEVSNYMLTCDEDKLDSLQIFSRLSENWKGVVFMLRMLVSA